MSSTFIATASVAVAALAVGISAWVSIMTRRDLTLTAYANAIQGGILDLKRTFADHPDIFFEQMRLNPTISSKIPPSMSSEAGIPTFLAFAGGMWRLSYVFSVADRGKRLGLNQDEVTALKEEMKLWLQALPGFYEVYEHHTEPLKVHNKRFLHYLEQEVYNAKFFSDLEQRLNEIPQTDGMPTVAIYGATPSTP